MNFFEVFIVVLVIAMVSMLLVVYIRLKLYLNSTEFQKGKEEAALSVNEHNEIVQYVSLLKAQGSLDPGRSESGKFSHLGEFTNTSVRNYRRDRNVADYASPKTHNCSLQVVRNAAESPIKYLMKYFDFPPTDEALARVERYGEQLARIEGALENLERRRQSISRQFRPPTFVLKYFRFQLLKKAGAEVASFDVPYPVYIFEYVSAGGNSSQRTSVRLDSDATDALINALSKKIRFRKSVAGQRALMTAKLRTYIKNRDNFKCCNCGVSVADEPTLLLEVDHIIPLSRGGRSSIENLQTLCWKCNRTKSNKLVVGF